MTELLRVATAGSVDDGKSTLIGRLLYDTKSLFSDQLEAVERTSRQRGDEYTDLALLTDGLRAEREQGITIDVAYRYFATPARKFILADQLDTLEKKAAGAPIDLSLLTDGLEAEREQGITIDVAYRYFATKQRKFIIADAPGHEQYTRNMATGASTADLAVILVNAAAGLTRQTKRHALIVSIAAIREVRPDGRTTTSSPGLSTPPATVPA